MAGKYIAENFLARVYEGIHISWHDLKYEALLLMMVFFDIESNANWLKMGKKVEIVSNANVAVLNHRKIEAYHLEKIYI